MDINKKAIGSFLIVLIGVSFFMSLLMFFVLDVFYQEDNERCMVVDYTIDNICRGSSTLDITIRNNANIETGFQADGEGSVFVVPASESATMKVSTDAKDVELMPLVTAYSFETESYKTYQCRSKLKKAGGNTIGRC